jgi:hypothetical protein
MIATVEGTDTRAAYTVFTILAGSSTFISEVVVVASGRRDGGRIPLIADATSRPHSCCACGQRGPVPACCLGNAGDAATGDAVGREGIGAALGGVAAGWSAR